MFNNSISISVSDDDLDEPGRMRARVRRKRKKPGVRFGGTELTQRFVRLLVRYWALLIFVLALGLLLFEATRIGRKVNSGSSGVGLKKAVGGRKEGGEKRSMGDLNRLDPTTRVVGGVRERCLKLLPLVELQQLDIPVSEESNSPIKNTLYMSGELREGEGGNASFSRQMATDSRFNLFTGNQSYEQREESFQVKETVQVHCGFYSESGGFKISEEDKNFMENCIAVVATCAFGGGDDLYQPIGMTDASIHKVSYIAFWDEVTLAAQESEGYRIDGDGFIGKWRIVVVKNLPFVDQRLNGKIPKNKEFWRKLGGFVVGLHSLVHFAFVKDSKKMLAHRLFPRAKYSIWVDSKSQFRRDPLGVLEALLWRSNSVLAMSEHGARSSVYDEAKAVVKKNKATPEEVEVQLTQYKKDGLPEDKRFRGKKALAEASVIVREHTSATNLFMCLWFNEVVRFTSRDQLSFPYVLWRLGVIDNINIFPVCTRKDLVNSMGHLRKAKPLIIS